MDVDTTALTPREHEVFETLPASPAEVANELGMAESRVRAHVSTLRDKLDVSIPFSEESQRYELPIPDGTQGANQPTNASIKETYLTTQAKQTVTKEYREWAEQAERWFNEILLNTEPAVAAPEPQGSQDVVIHRSDDHIGEHVEDQDGNVIFNPEIAKQCINKVTRRAIEITQRMGQDVGTVYLLLGGDTVTGENTYKGQAHDITLTLDQQVQMATDEYLKQIRALADRFPRLVVVVQSGNHGDVGSGHTSPQANADRIAYKALDALVRTDPDLDNVTFLQSDTNKYVNFTIRGHKAHLRHGQDSLSHIGTSAGKRKWLHWKDRHDYDIGYRGHYHEFKIEHPAGTPVLMSGSICPPSDFEDTLAAYSQPTATVHGVTDKRPLKWIEPVYFDTSGR